MAYYKYVEMNSLEPEEVIILENICMVVSGEWHYEEVEETKKMMKMFENSEEVLAKIMSIKEIDIRRNRRVLTKKEKRLGMIEAPEEWIAEIDNQRKSSHFMSYLDDTSVEMLKALAKFFLKIAVYHFCTVYWPKLARLDKINEEDIKMLQKELKHWEFCFWIHISFRGVNEPDIISERKVIKSEYDNTYYSNSRSLFGSSSTVVLGWIQEAYEDCKEKNYYENTKKLRLKYNIAEIESMRNLLDIIEKHLCDDLTPQNIADFKANMQDWEKDIEKLSALFNNLPALDLKTD
ncbi:hypothetical protein EBB54_13425 [Schaedlerella arabinosiphila]|jgi:hypothetical protein|uniref:Uncharacterized protein n=1 Tax=Schaedlerella arabinosiphila TaxID=2044587 RepID=A0A426DHQ5_9FIRM|nr:hypothetical protein [Schaedlerella arabinosiphila]RRK32251.1 hypothetical protein EBB54_13425 [Schaedlerella arabinosiphila]